MTLKRLRPFWVVLIALSAIGRTPLAWSTVSVLDNQQRLITLAAPAQRIISLAPHVTELLYSAGAGERLVGAVSYSDYPPAAQQLPRVGSYDRLDLEQILALNPDLVIGWPSGNPDGALERLRTLGVPLFMSEPLSFEQIADNIQLFGQLAGTEEVAEQGAKRFLQRLAAVQARYRGAPEIPVFYQVWQDPLMTISGDHIISKVLALCSGRNLFPELPRLAASINLEAVLAADPTVIIMPATNAHWAEQWQRWTQLTAVREQRLLTINPDHLSRPTARVVDGAEEVCRKLHPGWGQ